MWTCPKCHNKFFNKNQSHSCGDYTVDDFLKDRSEKTVSLFHHLLAEYRKIGEFELHPVKTRVALLTKMCFCSINKLGKDYLSFHLVLTELYKHSCFFKIDNLDNRFFVHHIKMEKNSDINDEVRKFMKLAYQVGNREHVTSQRKIDKS